jgi:hypothetical protein
MMMIHMRMKKKRRVVDRPKKDNFIFVVVFIIVPSDVLPIVFVV